MARAEILSIQLRVLVSLMLRTELMGNVVRHYLRLETGETDRQTDRQTCSILYHV